MDAGMMNSLYQVGAFSALGISAIGSGLGAGAAGAAAVGAWKKCYAQGKPAPFQLVVFAGAPLSQTIYGMVLMFIYQAKAAQGAQYWPLFLAMGVVTGLGLAYSSWQQGIAAAAACDAFGEVPGKGFVNYLMILGIIETVSIFVLVFAIVLLVMVAK